MPIGPMNDSNGEHHWIVPRDGSAVTDLGPPCKQCNSFSYMWSPNGRWIAGLYEQFDALGPGSTATGNTIGIGVVIYDTVAASGPWSPKRAARRDSAGATITSSSACRAQATPRLG